MILAKVWNYQQVTDQETELLDLEVFFDPHTQHYLFPTETGWIPLAENRFKNQLVELGYRNWRKKKKDGYDKDEQFSPLDRILTKLQREKHVTYAAPLAGYSKGARWMNEEMILVTKSPRRIKRAPGDFKTIKTLFENLFDDGMHDQKVYLFGWLKIAVEGLDSETPRPGQALVLAGEAGSGKSLLQDIVTEFLGGRSAKPFRYMSGLTAFNAELFQAEHLIIEDEASFFSTTKRVEFGTRIKDITVNRTHSCHGKGRQAIQLKPNWRLSISLNDEPEHLQILPPMDESIRDKMMLLKVIKKPMPMHTRTIPEREAFREAISAELPAFRHWLHDWDIPAELSDERYGIQTFHHPAIIEQLEHIGPEMRVLEYLRIYLNSSFESAKKVSISKSEEPWVGTAAQLANALHFESSAELRSLLSWSGALGTYLARLQKKFPAKISQSRKADRRDWIIQRDI